MPIPKAATKLRRSLAREQVYSQLREWITEIKLEPGEMIRDYELAATLGVSRTPVREALRRLEDEGLVETASHRWTKVAPVYTEEANDLYGVVKTLEVYALELAYEGLSKIDLDVMEEANAAMSTAVQQHVALAAVQADTTFHQVWIEKAGNKELLRVLGEVKAKIRRMELVHFNSDDAAGSVIEHASILKALRHGQLKDALRHLKTNWEVEIDRFENAVPFTGLSGAK